MTFEEALRQHLVGRTVSPNARSVERERALLLELNETLDLLWIAYCHSSMPFDDYVKCREHYMKHDALRGPTDGYINMKVLPNG